MPDNNELVSILRTVIQDELNPFRHEFQEFRQEVRQEIQELRQEVKELRQGQVNLEAGQAGLETRQANLEAGQADLIKGQAAIEAQINDLRATNRGTHKKIFAQLDAIWSDIKRIDNRLDIQEKKAVR